MTIGLLAGLTGMPLGALRLPAVYAVVPELIRFYLGEEPVLQNVPTYLGWREDDRRYMDEHLEELIERIVERSKQIEPGQSFPGRTRQGHRQLDQR